MFCLLNKQILQLIDEGFYSAFLQIKIPVKALIFITTNNKEKLFQEDTALKDRSTTIKVEGENYREKKKLKVKLYKKNNI